MNFYIKPPLLAPLVSKYTLPKGGEWKWKWKWCCCKNEKMTSALVKSWKYCNIFIFLCFCLFGISSCIFVLFFLYFYKGKSHQVRPSPVHQSEADQARPVANAVSDFDNWTNSSNNSLPHSDSLTAPGRGNIFHSTFSLPLSPPNHSDIISGSSKKGRLYLKRTRLSGSPKA